MYIVHKLGKMIALFPSALRHRTNGNHLERERKKEKVMNEDDFPVYDHFSSFFFLLLYYLLAFALNSLSMKTNNT